ncbi:hypothetical protein HG530_004391 [Fusarium avenaceum]|nr:hypothetical protein HG530_004391 [Fusarium avenaceum]
MDSDLVLSQRHRQRVLRDLGITAALQHDQARPMQVQLVEKTQVSGKSSTENDLANTRVIYVWKVSGSELVDAELLHGHVEPALEALCEKLIGLINYQPSNVVEAEARSLLHVLDESSRGADQDIYLGKEVHDIAVHVAQSRIRILHVKVVKVIGC